MLFRSGLESYELLNRALQVRNPSGPFKKMRHCSSPARGPSEPFGPPRGAWKSAFLKRCPGDAQARPRENRHALRPAPASGRCGSGGGLGLGAPPASRLPSPRRDGRPRGQGMAAKSMPGVSCQGCSAAVHGHAVHPLPSPRRNTRRGRTSPERLLGERAHQELQQRWVEGAGRFPRPLALLWGRPRHRRVHTPLGDRGRPCACPPQR